MKTINQTTVSKIVAKFDQELKNILMNDLKAVRNAKQQFIGSINSNLLPAA